MKNSHFMKIVQIPKGARVHTKGLYTMDLILMDSNTIKIHPISLLKPRV